MSKVSSHPGKPSGESLSADVSADRLCPFCGTLNVGFDSETPCSKCLIADTPAARNAAHARVGPWFVLHSRNPSAPGMTFAAIIGLIRRGQVKPRSVVRGPTTHQLWQFAAQARGLSREFGVCFDCGKPIDKQAHFCIHCQKIQEAPSNPDAFLETFTDAQRQATPEPAPAAPEPGDDFEPHIPNADVLNMQHLAAAFSVQYVAPGYGKRGPVAKFMIGLLLALLLGALALAAYCIVQPDFFEQMKTWISQHLDALMK